MSTPFSAADHEFMARALRLAERGLYTTDPNPRVGCVLVRDGQVVEYGERARLAADPTSRFYSLLQTGLEEVLA